MRRKNALPISALENADPTSSLSLIAGLCSLALGVIFYFLLRGQLGFLHLGSKINLPINIIFLNSAPSFFHSLAFTSFSVAFGVPKLRAVMAWCLAGFVWESAQGLLPFLGTHDAHDIYASCIGSMCGGIVRAILERIFYQSRPLLPMMRSTSASVKASAPLSKFTVPPLSLSGPLKVAVPPSTSSTPTARRRSGWTQGLNWPSTRV